jgi:hypothetical protein
VKSSNEEWDSSGCARSRHDARAHQQLVSVLVVHDGRDAVGVVVTDSGGIRDRDRGLRGQRDASGRELRCARHEPAHEHS